jgi:hypothetical protein
MKLFRERLGRLLIVLLWFGRPVIATALQVPDLPVKVEVVRISVLVKGRDGPLPDLTAADFEVRDNGVPQEIEAISSAARVGRATRPSDKCSWTCTRAA